MLIHEVKSKTLPSLHINNIQSVLQQSALHFIILLTTG